jgi:hypothetical protein
MQVEKPGWLEGKAVYLLDAGDESEYGSSKTDIRLQYSISLFDVRMPAFRLDF